MCVSQLLSSSGPDISKIAITQLLESIYSVTDSEEIIPPSGTHNQFEHWCIRSEKYIHTDR